MGDVSGWLVIVAQCYTPNFLSSLNDSDSRYVDAPSDENPLTPSLSLFARLLPDFAIPVSCPLDTVRVHELCKCPGNVRQKSPGNWPRLRAVSPRKLTGRPLLLQERLKLQGETKWDPGAIQKRNHPRSLHLNCEARNQVVSAGPPQSLRRRFSLQVSK